MLPRSDLKGSMSATLGESWAVAFDAQADTENRDQSLPSEFLRTDWQWQVGQANFRSQGSTLAALLDNAHGAVDLQGVYAAADELPVRLTAKMDGRGGRVGADDIQLKNGDSTIAGSAWIDEGQQNLFLRLDAKLLDLTQLLSQPAAEKSPAVAGEPGGLEIPDLGWWPSDMQIDAKLTSGEFRLPGLVANKVDLEFVRAKQGDQLRLEFAPAGTGA